MHLCLLKFISLGKLYHTFCFPPASGSCNSKMLLVKSWDRIHFKKFMIIKVARKISIITFLFFCFHKMLQATFFVTIPYSWRKIWFYNISGAIHSNNISVILILFEYFRNMYPYHRLFRNANLKYYFEMQLFVLCS